MVVKIYSTSEYDILYKSECSVFEVIKKYPKVGVCKPNTLQTTRTVFTTNNCMYALKYVLYRDLNNLYVNNIIRISNTLRKLINSKVMCEGMTETFCENEPFIQAIVNDILIYLSDEYPNLDFTLEPAVSYADAENNRYGYIVSFKRKCNNVKELTVNEISKLLGYPVKVIGE